MELQLKRFSSRTDDTLGLWFIESSFECFCIEDEHRDKKVKGETRIPEGRYEIKLRKEGGFHQRYLKRFGTEFHKGMLHITNIPNFKYVLIHILNKESQTEGCLGTGDILYSNNNGTNGYLGESTKAYKRFYPKVRDELLKGKQVFVTIINIEKL